MDYENHIPDGYREAYETLNFLIRMSPDVAMKRKLYDSFSQKFTMLSFLWEKRIQLELPPEPVTITKDVFELCLKLKKKAMAQFYYHRYLVCFPGRLQEPCKPEKMKKLVQVYHLPYVEVLSKICDIKLKEAFRILACKKMEPFLTFPHSQLSRFYHHYQRNSGTPLPADIKEKYEKAVKSYQKMITVAMKPYEWVQWMKESFEEEYWISNFECKLGEHFFMREIWLEYIAYLDGQNNLNVLNVYKRYCRLFVQDVEIRQMYSNATKKYKSLGCPVNPWLLDQAQFEVDFISGDAGLPALKALLKDECSTEICRECFEVKNQHYFNGSLSHHQTPQILGFWRKKKEILGCFLCDKGFGEKDESDGKEEGEVGAEKEMILRKSLAALRASSIQFHPVVKITFRGSLDPPIPRSIFRYILETANHQVLAKLYATAKYFFVKQLILLCYRIRVSSTPTVTHMEQALFTNAKAILKSPLKKFCCGTTLTFLEGSSVQKGMLSKCLPKLCCCSLTHLILHDQNLCLDEFETLLSGGKMEQLELKEVRIFKENEKMMKVEEIIEMCPTVVDLTINTKSRKMFSPQTARQLAVLHGRDKKFEAFRLNHVPDTFHLGWFESFLQLHMQPRGHLRLRLRENVNDQFRLTFQQFLSSVKSHWLPAYQGPQFGYYE